jgi:hypothetical protein
MHCAKAATVGLLAFQPGATWEIHSRVCDCGGILRPHFDCDSNLYDQGSASPLAMSSGLTLHFRCSDFFDEHGPDLLSRFLPHD